MRQRAIAVALMAVIAAVVSSTAFAQVITQRPGIPSGVESKLPPPPPQPVGPDYRIGVADVLVITAWKEEVASGEVTVRPDGKVTLKMGDEIIALGLTTDEFKKKVEEQLKMFYDPVPPVQIQVKEINSRLVYISGAVPKPGPYRLAGPMNVNQLISLAGGLLEFADKKKVLVIRGSEKDKNGQSVTFFINYKELMEGKNLRRTNPDLLPGDQVVVRGG